MAKRMVRFPALSASDSSMACMALTSSMTALMTVLK
jgi:hypothetical protein